jgi:hypothetical protein
MPDPRAESNTPPPGFGDWVTAHMPGVHYTPEHAWENMDAVSREGALVDLEGESGASGEAAGGFGEVSPIGPPSPFRDQAVQEVAADFASRGYLRHEGGWARKVGEHFYPVSSQAQATLEQATALRVALLERAEAARQQEAEDAPQRAQQAHQETIQARQAPAQSAAAAMGDFRVQWPRGPEGPPQLRGGLNPRTGRPDYRMAAPAYAQEEFQQRYGRELAAQQAPSQPERGLQPEAPSGMPSTGLEAFPLTAPGEEGEAGPSERPGVGGDTRDRRRGGGWGNAWGVGAAAGAVGGLVGAGIGGLALLTGVLGAGAGMALSPFGQSGQSVAHIGQEMADLMVQGIKFMGIIGAGAIGFALGLALPGPIGLGIGIAAGAIAAATADAFGAIGKAVTSIVGDIGNAFKDLVETGKQLAETVMGISYRTGQSAQTGARIAGIGQAFNLPPEEVQRTFGGWAQRPEFFRPRLEALEGRGAAGPGTGDIDPAQALRSMRAGYRRRGPMMGYKMLEAETGGPPSTQLLAMMNMPQGQFEASMKQAEGYERNAAAMERFQEVLEPVMGSLRVAAGALKMDVLQALLPLFTGAVHEFTNILNAARVPLQHWLVEQLPHYLSVFALGLIGFAEKAIDAYPKVIRLLEAFAHALEQAYTWVQQHLTFLHLPALPGSMGGPTGTGAGAGSGAPGTAGATGGSGGGMYPHDGGFGGTLIPAAMGLGGKAWGAFRKQSTGAQVVEGLGIALIANSVAKQPLARGAYQAAQWVVRNPAVRAAAPYVLPAIAGGVVGGYAGSYAQGIYDRDRTPAGEAKGMGMNALGILGGAAAGAGIGAGIGVVGGPLGIAGGAVTGAIIGGTAALVGEGVGALHGPTMAALHNQANVREQQQLARDKAHVVTTEDIYKQRGWWGKTGKNENGEDEYGSTGTPEQNRWARDEAIKQTQAAKVAAMPAPESRTPGQQAAHDFFENLKPIFQEAHLHALMEYGAATEKNQQQQTTLDGELISRALEPQLAQQMERRTEMGLA